MENALSEKQVMSQICHRNVCKYIDSFVESGNKLCLIMEYADKGDLNQYLQRLKSMAAASSSLVAAPIADKREK